VLLLFAQCKMRYWWLVSWLDLTIQTTPMLAVFSVATWTSFGQQSIGMFLHFHKLLPRSHIRVSLGWFDNLIFRGRAIQLRLAGPRGSSWKKSKWAYQACRKLKCDRAADGRRGRFPRHARADLIEGRRFLLVLVALEALGIGHVSTLLPALAGAVEALPRRSL
jgi:hypothetical protein